LILLFKHSWSASVYDISFHLHADAWVSSCRAIEIDNVKLTGVNWEAQTLPVMICLLLLRPFRCIAFYLNNLWLTIFLSFNWFKTNQCLALNWDCHTEGSNAYAFEDSNFNPLITLVPMRAFGYKKWLPA